ncbi:hypothetical protein [Chitinimonas naiadis]
MNKPTELHTPHGNNKAEHDQKLATTELDDKAGAKDTTRASVTYTAGKDGLHGARVTDEQGGVELPNPFAYSTALSRGIQQYFEMMEHHTVQYFTALESFFAALRAPAMEQLEKQLDEWQASTNSYRLALARKPNE